MIGEIFLGEFLMHVLERNILQRSKRLITFLQYICYWATNLQTIKACKVSIAIQSMLFQLLHPTFAVKLSGHVWVELCFFRSGTHLYVTFFLAVHLSIRPSVTHRTSSNYNISRLFFHFLNFSFFVLLGGKK